MFKDRFKLPAFCAAALPSVLLTAAGHAAMVPFVLPWNDASDNFTNISDWSHKPAGKYGFLHGGTDGELHAGNQRIRLWGVNLTGGACFPSNANARQVAARMSRFGINVVRFHHMNAPWLGDNTLIDYSQGNSRSLRPSTLDKFDFLLNELKQNGIYSNLNLLVSRKFYAADGFPAEIEQLGWKESHTIGHFNSHHLDLQKEFASQLLNHVNPYTGLALKDDPAIATVEILNENSAFKAWFSGDFDAWPEVFQQQITPRWNEWLLDKYGSTAAMSSAWGIISEPLGADLLANGDLRQGSLPPWTLEQHQGASGSINLLPDAYMGQPALRVEVLQTGAESWHLQAKYDPVELEAGKVYTLSLLARGSNNQALGVNISRNYDPWTHVGVQKSYVLDSDWLKIEISFESEVADNNLRIILNGFAKLTGMVDIASLTLKEGGTVGGLPEGSSLEDGTIPWPRLSRNDASASSEMIRDWLRFLLFREKAYISEMEDHIRNTIGYPGIVLSTQTGYAPAEALYNLSAADSHAYWNHPRFPGTAWDPYNWYIDNESMANDPPGTLWSLAKRRIRGIPYFVSEYQHAFPNTYSTEAPLLMGAYAALQNWDGIYFFNYGNQPDDWDRGFFDGYFDMSVHPGNMANLILGAALFRREDVMPAVGVIRYPSPSELFFDQVVGRPYGGWISGIEEIPFDDKYTMLHRLEVDPAILNEPQFDWPLPLSGSVYSSDTGELAWDASISSKAVVTVNTPLTKVVAGFVNGRTFDFDGIRVSPHPNQQDWLTFGITALAGNSILSDDGSRCLLIATGECGNSGMQWNQDKTSLLNNNWGTAPSVIEVIGADISLPVAASRTRVWALDETGERVFEIQVQDINGHSAFSIGAPSQTLWYEVEIAPVPMIRSEIEVRQLGPDTSTVVSFTVVPAVSQDKVLVEQTIDLNTWSEVPPEQLHWQATPEHLSSVFMEPFDGTTNVFFRASLLD